jgi:hypothetical protein
MFLIVQSTSLLITCLGVALCYAAIYVMVQLFLCRPSSALAALILTQQDTKRELASIKSVQQDFVRHSRLNRKVIQLDKDVAAKKCKSMHTVHITHILQCYRSPVCLCVCVFSVL